MDEKRKPDTQINNEPTDNQNSDNFLQPARTSSYLVSENAPSAIGNSQYITYPFQNTVKKRSKWRYFFVLLSTLQLAGIVIFVVSMLFAFQMAQAGASGTEFIALTLFITVVPAVAIISLINLICLPIYIWNVKPEGKARSLFVLSLVFSIMPLLFGASTAYTLYIEVPRDEALRDAESTRKYAEEDRQFKLQNAKPEISKDEAIKLIENCEIKGLYYTNQTDKISGNWGELSQTGIILTKIEGVPYRISIADRLIPELIPIARQAQNKCDDLQFWHNGHYEQKQTDGTWR